MKMVDCHVAIPARRGSTDSSEQVWEMIEMKMFLHNFSSKAIFERNDLLESFLLFRPR